ncbi:High affinity sulfate transporter 1 [Hibiscus syriacus]|uniref:High affinity sulfate transporter 1 n=1 Tax=Hibiscus syriacus TaxID=106335 RepID=A0A6A3CU81_HIBSY|nr:High affinity sulfate transporter 1 [Hibiscus syriacus]
MSKRVTDELGNMEIDVISVSSSRHGSENSTYVHKVGNPPKKTLLTEIGCIVKETFFSDDPLRNFKDQPRSRKFVLGLQAVFPILEWGRHYSLSKFKGDFIAGLTIASLCIPQDIGYGRLAYLLPQYGLYSSFVPPLIYAFMGSSRDIAIGPVAVVSLLLGTLLQNEIDPSKNPLDYRRLAFTATFFAGVTQATLGFFRLGFLIDFLSHAAIVGFMAGAAVTIALQQLKGLLGVKKFTKKTDIVSVMRSVFHAAHHGWNWQTILIGLSFLAFLLVAKYIGKKKKKLFWVPAIAPMISVVLSTFFVYITRADKHSVQIVKHIRKGINPPSVDEIFFSGEYLAKGFRIGVLAGSCSNWKNICFHEGLAVGWKQRNDSIRNNEYHQVDDILLRGHRVLFSLGSKLHGRMPYGVISLIDIEAMSLIWKIDKFDFVACMGAFFGVVFSSVEIGLLIAVSISFAKILLQVTRPRTAVLGKLPRTTVYRNIRQYPDAAKIPGTLIVRVDSAIYFSNSNYIKERILRWLMDEEEKLKENSQPRIQYLVVEMSPVTNIDTSGIHAMEELLRSLEKRDVKLVLANPGPVVFDKLHASKFHEMIGEDKIFLTVEDAVKTCAPKMDLEP